jgi:hypothetical protein
VVDALDAVSLDGTNRLVVVSFTFRLVLLALENIKHVEVSWLRVVQERFDYV